MEHVFKIGDKVRTVNYPSKAWNDRPGIVEAIYERDQGVSIAFTDGVGYNRGGFAFEHVQLQSELTPAELAKQWRDLVVEQRIIREKLTAAGYTLFDEANVRAIRFNLTPPHQLVWRKTVTTTEKV